MPALDRSLLLHVAKVEGVFAVDAPDNLHQIEVILPRLIPVHCGIAAPFRRCEVCEERQTFGPVLARNSV